MHRILLINDEPMLQDVYRQFLTGAGYEVCEASDVEEGLQQFQTHPIDLVLTDLRMPKRNGFVLLRTLRTPAAALDAHQIIQKPISLLGLLVIIRELLGEA